MKTYRVRVTREGDENGDYAYSSGYAIQADDYNKAEREARQKFCDDFGAPFDKTTAYTHNKYDHEQ